MSFNVTGRMYRDSSQSLFDLVTSTHGYYRDEEVRLQVQAAVHKIAAAARDFIRTPLNDGGVTPVDTEALIATTFVNEGENTLTVGASITPKGDGKHYGWYQEIGTSHNLPRLYVYQTAEYANTELNQMMAGIVGANNVTAIPRDAQGRFVSRS